MFSIQEQGWGKVFDDEETGQTVLSFIVEERVVTLESIIERFPGVRWGDLFAIMSKFRREGLVTIHQVGSHMEIRMREQACQAV